MSRQIPKFRNEDEEREFWATHDSADLIDWRRAKKITFANLKPSVKKISLRLPESMLNELKLLANKKDVPYQSLLKIFLAERIEKELNALWYTVFFKSTRKQTCPCRSKVGCVRDDYRPVTLYRGVTHCKAQNNDRKKFILVFPGDLIDIHPF